MLNPGIDVVDNLFGSNTIDQTTQNNMSSILNHVYTS